MHFVPVQLGANDGKTTRVTDGSKGGETIGVDVPVDLEEGATVQPMPKKPSEPTSTPHAGEPIAPKQGDLPITAKNLDAGRNP